MRAWRVGAPRATPKGDPLIGTYDQSYWTSGSIRQGEWKPDAHEPDTLVNAIKELLRLFAEHKQFFKEIRSSGGSVEFFVGWFLGGDTGGVFKHDLLREMAGLGIDLSLDIYPPDRAALESARPQP